MNSANGPWAPLIVAKHVPRFVKWRDTLLTVMMWIFFVVLLDLEFELFLGRYLQPDLSRFDAGSKWPLFFERLMPFLLMAATLAGLLIIFTARTLRRHASALLLPKPAPLETAEQAHHAGLDEVELIAARDQRIVVVYIDADGKHRIETPHGR
jgi:poly-beta-1,6-N-acetyl-D-glucosamine biosynthesis protein PgaD